MKLHISFERISAVVTVSTYRMHANRDDEQYADQKPASPPSFYSLEGLREQQTPQREGIGE